MTAGPALRRLAYCAAALLGGALASTAAQASPVLSYELFLDGSAAPISSGDNTGGTPGFLSVNSSTSLFSVLQMSANGVPVVPSPDLSTITTSITSASGFSGTHTLTLYITQAGLTVPTNLIGFNDTINLNNNVGGGIASAASLYLDPLDRSFAAATGSGAILLGSLTGTAGTNVTNGIGGQTTYANAGSGPYSETEMLSATFTGSQQTLSTNLQLVNVPEPSALALLALPAGLAGLLTVRRRRQTFAA